MTVGYSVTPPLFCHHRLASASRDPDLDAELPDNTWQSRTASTSCLSILSAWVVLEDRYAPLMFGGTAYTCNFPLTPASTSAICGIEKRPFKHERGNQEHGVT